MHECFFLLMRASKIATGCPPTTGHRKRPLLDLASGLMYVRSLHVQLQLVMYLEVFYLVEIKLGWKKP
jgi:hypothetical protein